MFFTLFFWFLTENIFIDMSSLAIDLRLFDHDQKLTHLDKTFLGISILMIISKLLIFIFLIIVSTKKTSMLYFLHDGLKVGWLWLIIYYTHFLFVWLTLPVLIFVTKIAPSKVVVFLLLGTQLGSLVLNCVKLYSSNLLHFQILTTWELNLLNYIAIMTSIQFNQSTSKRYGIAIGAISFAFSLLFSLSSLGGVIVSLIIRIKKWRNRRRVIQEI